MNRSRDADVFDSCSNSSQYKATMTSRALPSNVALSQTSNSLVQRSRPNWSLGGTAGAATKQEEQKSCEEKHGVHIVPFLCCVLIGRT